MRSVKNKKSLHVALAAFMALSTLTTLGFVQEVSAATAALGEVYVRFDRMKVSTATTGRCQGCGYLSHWLHPRRLWYLYR